MTRRVVWSSRSRADLRDIARYMAADNPDAAASVIARLRSAGLALSETPTGRPGRVDGTFEKAMPRLPYVLAYALEVDQVTILAVVHTARDWPAGGWPRD